MAGQNGLLFSKVPRHRSAVYLRIEQSSQLKQEFFIIFQCPLDGEQFTLAVGSVNQNGMTFTVDSVSVSPVALKVDYTVDSEVQWSDAPSGREPEEDSIQSQRYFENVEILLSKKDDAVIDLSSSGGSLNPENGVTVCDKGEVFDEILPLEDLESISVGGIVYPLNAA